MHKKRVFKTAICMQIIQLQSFRVGGQQNSEISLFIENTIGRFVKAEKQPATAAIIQLINKLPSKSSSGDDGISTTLIKKIKNEISKSLTLIINQCIQKGIFPHKLKLAKVIPIFKSGDETLFNNYRPISILPSLSKIFERVIFNQIHDYFNTHNLYYSNQYGFRKDHSTELAALEIIDRITQHLDKGATPINIYLDLSKAFDTLDHNILLHKLKHYGIQDNALDLFRSYLTERQQYVDFNGTKSNREYITTGVPQGSILGPILFIIYINDIAKSSKQFNFITYADDTTLCCTLNQNVNNINKELKNVTEWLKINCMRAGCVGAGLALVGRCRRPLLLVGLLPCIGRHGWVLLGGVCWPG